MSSSAIPTTTRLWASWATRGERAARQARAGDEAEPDPAGREVPFDDGDLGEAGLGVGDRPAVDDDGLANERLRHDLILDQPDRADRLRSHGIAKSQAVTGRTRTVCRTHSGTGTDGTSIGRPRLRTTSGTNLLEVGEHEEIGLVPGRDRTEVARGRATAAGWSDAISRASSGATPRQRRRAPSR